MRASICVCTLITWAKLTFFMQTSLYQFRLRRISNYFLNLSTFSLLQQQQVYELIHNARTNQYIYSIYLEYPAAIRHLRLFYVETLEIQDVYCCT